jgi:hypothetical protein
MPLECVLSNPLMLHNSQRKPMSYKFSDMERADGCTVQIGCVIRASHMSDVSSGVGSKGELSAPTTLSM